MYDPNSPTYYATPTTPSSPTYFATPLSQTPSPQPPSPKEVVQVSIQQVRDLTVHLAHTREQMDYVFSMIDDFKKKAAEAKAEAQASLDNSEESREFLSSIDELEELISEAEESFKEQSISLEFQDIIDDINNSNLTDEEKQEEIKHIFEEQKQEINIAALVEESENIIKPPEKKKFEIISSKLLEKVKKEIKDYEIKNKKLHETKRKFYELTEADFPYQGPVKSSARLAQKTKVPVSPKIAELSKKFKEAFPEPPKVARKHHKNLPPEEKKRRAEERKETKKKK